MIILVYGTIQFSFFCDADAILKTINPIVDARNQFIPIFIDASPETIFFNYAQSFFIE